jgi:hypothetical protein
MTHHEKQLRLYSCSTDKTMQNHRYAPAEKRFVLAHPKELVKNRIHRIATTEQSLIVAKDQGQLISKTSAAGRPSKPSKKVHRV